MLKHDIWWKYTTNNYGLASPQGRFLNAGKGLLTQGIEPDLSFLESDLIVPFPKCCMTYVFSSPFLSVTITYSLSITSALFLLQYL